MYFLYWMDSLWQIKLEQRQVQHNVIKAVRHQLIFNVSLKLNPGFVDLKELSVPT